MKYLEKLAANARADGQEVESPRSTVDDTADNQAIGFASDTTTDHPCAPHKETAMTTERPQFTKDPMYQMLRVDDTQGFNLRKEQGQTCDLRGVDLRGLDLRGLDADGLDLTGSYFRDADLRGVDLSGATLDGCSFYGAKISGALFPRELSAEEIRLSVEHGTRVRYR